MNKKKAGRGVKVTNGLARVLQKHLQKNENTKFPSFTWNKFEHDRYKRDLDELIELRVLNKGKDNDVRRDLERKIYNIFNKYYSQKKDPEGRKKILKEKQQWDKRRRIRKAGEKANDKNWIKISKNVREKLDGLRDVFECSSYNKTIFILLKKYEKSLKQNN